jgi:hypothetical protein
MQFRPLDFTVGYHDDETQHFMDPRQVHDFTHYVDNPRVHLRLLRTLLGNDRLGSAEAVTQVVAGFLQRYPLTASDPFRPLRALFGDSSDKPLSVLEVAQYLSRAFTALKGLT